jgi:hypothetical protein
MPYKEKGFKNIGSIDGAEKECRESFGAWQLKAREEERKTNELQSLQEGKLEEISKLDSEKSKLVVQIGELGKVRDEIDKQRKQAAIDFENEEKERDSARHARLEEESKEDAERKKVRDDVENEWKERLVAMADKVEHSETFDALIKSGKLTVKTARFVEREFHVAGDLLEGKTPRLLQYSSNIENSAIASLADAMAGLLSPYLVSRAEYKAKERESELKTKEIKLVRIRCVPRTQYEEVCETLRVLKPGIAEGLRKKHESESERQNLLA